MWPDTVRPARAHSHSIARRKHRGRSIRHPEFQSGGTARPGPIGHQPRAGGARLWSSESGARRGCRGPSRTRYPSLLGGCRAPRVAGSGVWLPVVAARRSRDASGSDHHCGRQSGGHARVDDARRRGRRCAAAGALFRESRDGDPRRRRDADRDRADRGTGVQAALGPPRVCSHCAHARGCHLHPQQSDRRDH